MSFQIVEETDNRLIVGVGPFPDGTTSADFGPGYELVTVEDDNQLEIMSAADGYYYLSADKKTITAGNPPA